MMTREETIQAYQAQSRVRLAWFLIALAVGTVAAVAFHLVSDWEYPAWNIGLLAWGIAFMPIFLVMAFSKELVSVREVMKARRELLDRGGPRV